MWKWSLDWGEVTPEILVGSCPMAPRDLETIQRRSRISAVLSVQHDDCLAYWGIDYQQMQAHGSGLGLSMARSPMRDFDLADQRRHLPAAVAALASLRAAGDRIYVHCTAGLGRSPLTVLGYLTWIEGRSPQEAIGLIQQGRPGAVPAWEAYHGCREELVMRNRARIETRAHERHEADRRCSALENWTAAETEVLRAVLATME